MALKAVMQKVNGGLRCDAAFYDEFMQSVCNGWHTVEIKKARNPGFHRKFFAMIGVGFGQWSDAHGIADNKENREHFRKTIIKEAGFFVEVVNLDGTIERMAKSISFGNMDDNEFNSLYQACAQVLLDRVLHNYTGEDLERAVEELLRF